MNGIESLELSHTIGTSHDRIEELERQNWALPEKVRIGYGVDNTDEFSVNFAI